MGRKTQKTLSMPVKLASRLEKENNQSKAVRIALRDYFDMTEADDGET